MSLEIIFTTDRISSDPTAREFIEHLRNAEGRLDLSQAVLYYDFPTYADYESVTHKPDALLLSKRHGIVPIRFLSSDELRVADLLAQIDSSLGQFCSILIGRLLKSRQLRRDRATLSFQVRPLLFAVSEIPLSQTADLESDLTTSFESLDEFLLRNSTDELNPDAVSEARSVIEGAKALTRPQRRVIEDPATQKLAAALAKLESQIANFDERQRRAAISTIRGPERIRGLAGSGKTIILAMKAAHLHLTRPDDMILVTFYTRSLRASIQNLITRFYRHYKDEDPDWDHLHVRHGWGGARMNGVYSDACRRNDKIPLSFGNARQASGGVDPFDFACRDLLQKVAVAPYYDQVLIDEGQDFPSGFYELCFALTKGERDQKNIIWAYDELQNVFNVKIRSPEALFGRDIDGQPRISLERASSRLPVGATNDIVLSKCYRNQREVLVVAHSLGFGIYRQIVQLLESREHWEDVGYEVVAGDFSVGEPVKILRPAENSPISLTETELSDNIIQWHVADSVKEETDWIVDGICEFLRGGLKPEEILVVSLDDRNVRAYFAALSRELALRDIGTNNIISDPYTEPPFCIAGRVTLSTVFRAKGNEAAVVFACGVDSVPPQTRSGRNKLFTAFTRTKAWLRVSGMGSAATDFCAEIQAALDHFPNIEFLMPDLRQVDLIQRDLSERDVKLKKLRDEFIRKLRKQGFSEDEISGALSTEVKNG
jgi:superfamily I DNA and RNA helicase